MEILDYLMEQVLPSAAQGASELHDGFADVLLHGDQGFLGAEPGALRGDDVQEVRLAVDVQGAGEKEGFSVGVVFLVQVLHLGGVVAVGDQGVLHLGDGGDERLAVGFRGLFRRGFLGAHRGSQGSALEQGLEQVAAQGPLSLIHI